VAPTWDGLTNPPETPLAIAAHQLVSASCPAHVVAHCERSVRFAMMLAHVAAIDVDAEVLYLGVIMHDLGLAPRFHSDARFDVGGANSARDWLVEAGMDVRRAGAVWDIVALHASSAIAQHKSPETAVANAGISIDVRGVGADRLPIDGVRRVLDEFPRAGFPEAFHRTLVDEVRRNPDAVRLSWMEGMAVRHVDGYRAADFEAALLDSSGFH
jgi:hypothetical protein